MYNLERQEIDHLKELGYKWDNLFDIIKMFENKISKYTGAPYVTVTDCCTKIHKGLLCTRQFQLFKFWPQESAEDTTWWCNHDRQQGSTRMVTESKIRW